MKVKMLVQTRFQGIALRAGQEYDVKDDVANRWVKNRIAVLSEKEPKDMTAKELYKLCLEKGIEVAEKQSKATYLEALGLAE